jgi:dUTP pyrophosphatase
LLSVGDTLLNDHEIKELIKKESLLTDYIDLETQLQPSGFDLSLSSVESFNGVGAVDYNNKERVIAETTPLESDQDGWFMLKQGCYKIVYNEAVRMPLNISAIARSRSTLLRNGASLGTAVWDPGYKGRSSSLLIVHNPNGIKLKKNARIAQLIFFHTGDVMRGYSGIYQNERMSRP